MATFTKFQDFIEKLGLGAINLNTDTFKAYATNATPNAATHSVKGDLAEITMTYGAWTPVTGGDIQNLYTETGGVGTMTGTTVVLTASGGDVGPFRYIVIYDDTHASDELMGYIDYGAGGLTLHTGETLTVTIGASIATFS